uniref:Uncharacterized protein n=1 Tax=Ananas comosus var. bracteatus TaxID=296719 RepID=A0A6V7PBT7_ANACO|nr:unnamed protein product [Ananas comosus var. bracteatus]
MTLVAGSYEKFIWGFSLKTLASPGPSDAQTLTLTLKRLFSYPSHTGPIKCVAACGPAAASGGGDSAIRLYDLPSSSELGSLLDHGGAVTALAFFAFPLAPSVPRNLVSASDDGAVCIYDADPFVHLRTVAVHRRGDRRGVADLAVHPSGRAALTVGRDAGLAMINLLRGRVGFSCRLDREASVVRYIGEEGERFVMATDERITVHDSEDARLIHEMNGGKRVLCVAPAESGILYVGGEDRAITAWDTTSGKVAYSIQDAHSSRIKGLVAFKSRNDDPEASNLVVSASSDGFIRVWDVRMTAKDKPVPLAEANTKSRLTCLAGSSLRM